MSHQKLPVSIQTQSDDALPVSPTLDAASAHGDLIHPSFCHLPRRKAQIASLLAVGAAPCEIALALGVSDSTVRTYIRRLRVTAGAGSLRQLTVWACNAATKGPASPTKK